MRLNEERRSFGLELVSVRADNPSGPIRFRGHAAVFKDPTWINASPMGFWEEVTPTAFDRALGEDDVRFLFNHHEDSVMASTSAGTLRLTKDKTGLVAEADLDPSDPDVQRIVPKLARGDLKKMSFAFVPREGGTEEVARKDGTWLRRLTDVELWDVSVVTYPAYVNTDAALRAIEARSAAVRTNQLDVARRRLEALKGR